MCTYVSYLKLKLCIIVETLYICTRQFLDPSHFCCQETFHIKQAQACPHSGCPSTCVSMFICMSCLLQYLTLFLNVAAHLDVVQQSFQHPARNVQNMWWCLSVRLHVRQENGPKKHEVDNFWLFHSEKLITQDEVCLESRPYQHRTGWHPIFTQLIALAAFTAFTHWKLHILTVITANNIGQDDTMSWEST